MAKQFVRSKQNHQTRLVTFLDPATRFTVPPDSACSSCLVVAGERLSEPPRHERWILNLQLVTQTPQSTVVHVVSGSYCLLMRAVLISAVHPPPATKTQDRYPLHEEAISPTPRMAFAFIFCDHCCSQPGTPRLAGFTARFSIRPLAICVESCVPYKLAANIGDEIYPCCFSQLASYTVHQ